MSVLQELMKEKRETRLENTRDRHIYFGIVHAYLDEHPNDLSIYDCFRQQNALANIVSNDHRWEPFYGGFLTRTNFAYDEETKEITFDEHRITKAKDGSYVPDQSKLSIEHVNNHIGDFTALAKVDEIIARYYERYSNKIDDGLNKSMNFFRNFREHELELQTYYANEHNKLFFNYYGIIGRELLIKWLNRLNDPNATIEELATEFRNDVATAELYLEAQEFPGYKKAKAHHLEMSSVLFRVLDRYSPRASHLKNAYRKQLEEQKNTITR